MAILGAGGLHAADPKPGDLDTGFAPVIGGGVAAAVPQVDGNILIGGTFTVVNGKSMLRGARVTSAGGLDESYAPNFDSEVYSINHGLDGKTFFTGYFAYVKNTSLATRVARNAIARFDGSAILDTTFIPPAGYATYCIREHTPGKYLVASEGGLRRLLEDFKHPSNFIDDSNFTSYPGSAVWHTDIQNDSRILLSGSFTAPAGGVNRRYVDRVTSAGLDDPEYVEPLFTKGGNVNIGAFVHSAIFQPDLNILVCGEFTEATVTIGGIPRIFPQAYLMRLNAIGNFDEGFRPAVNGNVLCMALQADGKILIGGDFTQISSTKNDTTTTLTRRGIARLNADGTVDATFDAKINPTNWKIQSITIQGDGKILITGAFTAINSIQRSQIARLYNDAATGDLRALDSNTIRWVPGGATPVATSVVFEHSTSGGALWTKFGDSFSPPAYINGGWQVASFLPLPNPCILRVRAQIPGGLHGSSYGVMVTPSSNYPIPRIAVTKNPSTDVVKDSTLVLGLVGTGTPWDFPFTLRNSGTGNLTGFTYLISGTDASQFSLVKTPVSPVAGPLGGTPFTLRFIPDGLGERNATLAFTSNDPQTPTFTFKLKGTGHPSEIEAWRSQYFGATSETGNAVATADPDADGQTNAYEFIIGSDPTDPASRFNQVVQNTPSVSRLVFSPRLTNRTYVVETSTTLESANWATATGTNVDADTQRTFTNTAAFVPTRFYRVKITKP